MMKETIKNRQPIVYQILYNALKNQKLAHAYLFHGAKGTLKYETAILLAQSILCKENDFACETCTTCKRIAKKEYSDFIYLDASEISLKKEAVLKLQASFSKTALEDKGKKVYVIDHVENATVDALNSLLKFIEEPSDDMIAILISEHLERVLPTIVSRCQLIPFKASGFKVIYEQSKKQMDMFDAYMLSNLMNDIDAMKEVVEEEAYQHAVYVFKEVMKDFLTDIDQCLLFMQTEGFPAKNKNNQKQAFLYLLDFLLILLKDCIKKQTNCEDESYLTIHQQFVDQNKQYTALMRIVMKAKDQLLRSCNMALLIDQMIYDMKEVIK